MKQCVICKCEINEDTDELCCPRCLWDIDHYQEGVPYPGDCEHQIEMKVFQDSYSSGGDEDDVIIESIWHFCNKCNATWSEDPNKDR